MTRKKTRSKWRRALRWFAFLILFVAAWFTINRLVSPMNAVRIVELKDVEVDESNDTPTTLRVCAYNIAHGRGLAPNNHGSEARAGRTQRLRDIAALLRAEEADIVILNEVDFDAWWSGHENQAALIAREAGLPYRVEQRNYDVSVPFVRIRNGNAVLSRFPIEAADVLNLPQFRQRETILAGQKRAAICTVLLPNGQRIKVVPVHFEHRCEPTRIRSAEVLQALAASSSHPIIAAGDFNSTRIGFPRAWLVRKTTAVSTLLDGEHFATEASDAPRFTFPAETPDREIDWILATRPCLVSNVRQIGGTLSDHLGVIADITLPGGD